MICVYVLKSLKVDYRYIGSTINLKNRLIEHNNGQVFSTKNRRPLKLFAYQKCDNIKRARFLEHKYKKSRGSYEKAIIKGLLIVVGA